MVINNAAIYPSRPFEEYSIEDFQRVQRINVDAGIVLRPGGLAAHARAGLGPDRHIASVTLSGGWANLALMCSPRAPSSG